MIPTEPIGSIPRPIWLVEALANAANHEERLEALYAKAVRDSIERFVETGSPVITDGEPRRYQNSRDYCVHGLPNIAPDGFRLPFVCHTRRWPRLTAGPFRYKRYADSFLEFAQRFAPVPVKQAVIAPSALSLMYPNEPLPDYSREQFIEDLLSEHEHEVRACLAKGAHCVQIDFTEARLALKLDPSKDLLRSFIELNNAALNNFSETERERIGIHIRPGNHRDSTPGAGVDYADVLPELFQLNAGRFYIALAGERDRIRILKLIRDHKKSDQRIFVGVINPVDPRIETAEQVRDLILEASRYIPIEQLGTTDDCGLAPFGDDAPTTRDTAFAKIRRRVIGTALADKEIRGG